MSLAGEAFVDEKAAVTAAYVTTEEVHSAGFCAAQISVSGVGGSIV